MWLGIHGGMCGFRTNGALLLLMAFDQLLLIIVIRGHLLLLSQNAFTEGALSSELVQYGLLTLDSIYV